MGNRHYLLRFDDLCPTMNWKVWREIEALLIEQQIKPVLAVVPDNKDPTLQVDPAVNDFWEHVRRWQDRGWTIALHGFQHRYVTKEAGLVALRKKSEFAGLPAEEQQRKLERGLEIFDREGITPKVWIAPGNSFDAVTVSLLPKFGVEIVCDGYFRFPFVCPQEMIWVPQQLFEFRPAPSGVWTVCFHHNHWNALEARQFQMNLERYRGELSSLDEALGANRVRKSRWSARLCTAPRLSRLLVRTQLKLWGCCHGN